MRRLLDIASLLRKDKEKPHFLIKEKHNIENLDYSIKDLGNSILHFKAQDAWSLGIRAYPKSPAALNVMHAHAKRT
jgi:hypothetical protein